VVIFTFILTLTLNGLANALPLNGRETGEISDSFDVFFVPAGYVFAIWGLIYLSLAAFTVYHSLPAQRENPRLRSIGWLFALSNVANALWIVLWHYGFYFWSVVDMLVLLVTLIAIYLRLDIGRAPVSRLERWVVNVPFSIYLGWITVATVANVTAWLEWIGWGGLGISEQGWAAIMLGVAVVVGALMALTRGDVAYLLVLVWAFVGIAIKHSGDPTVSTAAWVATGAVAALILYSLVRRPRKGAPQPAV
jgi:hypothetical protein